MIKDVKLIEVRELYELIEEEMAEMILAAETAEEEEILNQARERIHTLIGIEVMDNLTVRGTNENRAEREGEANED